MNFKKLASFVMILGILIFGYGGFQWATNQPKKFDPSESKPGIFGGRDDLANMLNVQETNLVREGKRKDATKIMAVGGVVLFIGIGVSASAKKQET